MAVELRPAQALRLLHEFAHALVTDDEPDLSARQLAVLLTIYLEPPPHTVRGLAAKLKRDQAGDHARARHHGQAGARLAPARRPPTAAT